MWFWFSVIALLFWSGSDLFSKIGCRDADDKYAHLKMVMAVGVVMGLHAAYEIFIGRTEINFSIIFTYLPVSLLYILSMALGYVGLRYIELSISSPICNSSGAMVAVLSIITGSALLAPAQYAAMALVCVGVIGLGIVEAREDDELRLARQEAGNYKYAKSALALVLPILYCVLDALGTFADSKVLETLNEDSANCAYELTFLAAGIACFVCMWCSSAGRSWCLSGRGPSTWALCARPPASSPISTPWRTRSMWPWQPLSSPPTAYCPWCGAVFS